jgi:hypothetical protein
MDFFFDALGGRVTWAMRRFASGEASSGEPTGSSPTASEPDRVRTGPDLHDQLSAAYFALTSFPAP